MVMASRMLSLLMSSAAQARGEAYLLRFFREQSLISAGAWSNR